MIREKAIKAALVDWLFDKGMFNDAILVSEMVIANWSRRADLAIANGRLYAYEIKSDGDSLKRLPGQIDSFSAHFDKVTVVAASKFVSSILKDYPAHVGVLEAYSSGSKIKFRQARAGRLVENRDIFRLSTFLTKAEIIKLLRQNGYKLSSDATRRQLVEMVSKLPLKQVKSFVLACVKARYSETSHAFFESRAIQGSLDSLKLLSKSESQLRAFSEVCECSQKAKSIFIENPNMRPLELDSLDLGELPDYMPNRIIVRKPKALVR